MIRYDLFFCLYKNELFFLTNYCKKQKTYYNGVGKENTPECYFSNKEIVKENAKNKYRNLSEDEEEAKRKHERDRFRNVKERKKQAKRILKKLSSNRKNKIKY